MKLTLVIPGLGDESSNNRIRRLVRFWQSNNHKVLVFNSDWSSGESGHEKIQRLFKFYDQNKCQVNNLVGFSAGGALAVILLSERPDIRRVITVSAKLKGSDSIGKKFQERAPALKNLVKKSEEKLPKIHTYSTDKLICFKPVFDNVVYKKDMSFKNFKTKLIPFIFHSPSIVFALLFQVKKHL